MTAMRVIIGGAAPLESPWANHLRASFAERHVPLPPELALMLARMLTSRQPVADPFWGRAFKVMAGALGVSGAVASQQLLKGAMDRFLPIVAEPVLREAARRAGVLVLPARDGAGADMTPTEDAAILRETDLALRDTGVMGRPFWVHAALDLHLAAVRAAGIRARIRVGGVLESLPQEVDPALAALVFLHPPEFDVEQQRQQTRRRARQIAALRRAGIRPKEGGVAGIIPSRQLDDLPDALMSELILPRALFNTKLLHDGLLVRHRPPRRDPKRDLLAVMLHQPLPDDGMGLLVQAAWADAAIRLRVALFQMGLANSDLIWSGPGTAVRLGCEFDLPGVDRLPPLAITGKARADMLMGSGLYPAHAILPRTAARPPEGDGLTGILRAGLMPLAQAHARVNRQIAQDYARRFLLVSEPHQGRLSADPAELRARHQVATSRDLGRCHWAALSWRRQGDDMPVLTGFADRRDPVEFTFPEDAGPDVVGADDSSKPVTPLAVFMGRLVSWMMDVTLEALDAG